MTVTETAVITCSTRVIKKAIASQQEVLNEGTIQSK